jgi:hypothetical protein
MTMLWIWLLVGFAAGLGFVIVGRRNGFRATLWGTVWLLILTTIFGFGSLISFMAMLVEDSGGN